MGSTEFDNVSAILEILRFDRLIALVIGIAAIFLIARGIQNLSGKLQYNYPGAASFSPNSYDVQFRSVHRRNFSTLIYTRF